jgi:hypothetical protein
LENEEVIPEQAYDTFIIIRFALLVSQFLFVGLLFLVKPELFRFDLTQPLLGSNLVVVMTIGPVPASALLAASRSRATKTGSARAARPLSVHTVYRPSVTPT